MSFPFKSTSIIVVSGGSSDPKILSGTGDPTSGVASAEGSIYLRFVASAGQLFVKTGPGDTDWSVVPIGASGGTLDQAYDFGGLGGGRIITADAGAVRINANTDDTQAALDISRSPTTPAGAVGINMTLGSNANTLSNGIQITDGGQGNSVYVQKNAAGVAFSANLTDNGAQGLVVTVNNIPTSVSPVSIVANQTGTTASLLSISKIPSGATAGAAISVSMGANTTGPGITVSTVGTGAAVQISSGALEMANSSPAVSASNQGRIKYDSASQTFQVSKNGGSYESVATTATRQLYTKAQDVAPSALTYGATISVDASLSNTFTVTLTGATAQLNNPTNLVDGQTVVFRISQDSMGGRDLTFDTNYDFGAAGTPTISSSTSNQVDIISGVSDGTKLFCIALRGF